MKPDQATTIQELKDLIVQFTKERDWDKHHSPKNLAMSIAIEAAELMELYQWDDWTKRTDQQVQDELADILIYAFSFAAENNIDIASAFREKLARAAKKYPAQHFAGDKDGSDEYLKAKHAERNKTA